MAVEACTSASVLPGVSCNQVRTPRPWQTQARFTSVSREDLSVFFGQDHPGTFDAVINGVATVRMHFFNSNDPAVLDVQTAVPFAYCAASDLPSIAPGFNVDIGSIRYVAREVSQDGTGIAMLTLERQ